MLAGGLNGPAAATDRACSTTRPVLSAAGTLDGLASQLRRGEPIRILAIGSSSTEGVGASSPAFAYPAQLQEDLHRAWNRGVVVENAGKGGETAIETVGRLRTALAERKPNLVIWQVGTNDAVRGEDEGRFVSLLEEGITAAQTTGVDLVLLDQQFYPGIRDHARYERFVQLVGSTAFKARVPVFSRYTLMKDWGGSAERLGVMLATDRFHMSDRGYDCVAQLLAESIQSLTTAPPSAQAQSRLASGR